MVDLFHKSFKSEFYLDENQLRSIANYVHFKLSYEQLNKFKKKFNDLLDLIDVLSNIDDDDEDYNPDFNLINYIHQHLKLKPFIRDDVIKKEEGNVFSNSQEKNNFFLAPKVLK